MDTEKTPKWKMHENTLLQFLQLIQLCSQIVFQIFWGGLKKCAVCRNHDKNCGFTHPPQKHDQHLSKQVRQYQIIVPDVDSRPGLISDTTLFC